MYNYPDMVYEVKKNDVLLKPHRNKNYPWNAMKVLDSFDVSCPEHGVAAMMAFYQARQRGKVPKDWKMSRTGKTIQRIA